MTQTTHISTQSTQTWTCIKVPFIIPANMDLSVWLAAEGTTAYSQSAAPNEDNDEDDQQAWPRRQPRMAGFMAHCAHPRHKSHFLWVDHSACPCFIDLAPLKFTTSAIPARRLTDRRFSAGMRSDGGRGRERRGDEERLVVGSLRRSPNGFGEKGKKGGKLKPGCRGVKWNENGKGGERHFFREDAARGVIREDWWLQGKGLWN